MTRSTSDHPSTNERGVLGQEYLFCGKQRQTSNRKKHSEAFQTLLNFLDSEHIKKKKPMLATAIFSLYKEEFLALGGTHDDIQVLLYGSFCHLGFMEKEITYEI